MPFLSLPLFYKKIMETIQRIKADTSLINAGDVFSRFSCGKVVAVSPSSITLKNTDGLEWSIDKSIVENEFAFASHSTNPPIHLSRTEIIELVKENPRVAMQITFNKKVDHKAVAKTLLSGKGNMTDRVWNKTVKDALAGEERVMEGVHHRTFDAHGRLQFTEIAGKSGMSGLRVVDLRTITSLIFHNQVYQVK